MKRLLFRISEVFFILLDVILILLAMFSNLSTPQLVLLIAVVLFVECGLLFLEVKYNND